MSSGTTPLAPEPLAGWLSASSAVSVPGQRVDLVGGEHGAVDEAGLLLGEQPLQAEQQRELAPPVDRGRLVAGVDLSEGRVQRTSTS